MRRPAALLLLIGLLLVKNAWCQSAELLVQGEAGKLYLLHSVTPKENWYSVGRLYNLSPKEIAPFNNLTIDRPLSIGQTLQIPLTTVNFSQSTQKAAAGETLVPVYHIVQEKEWMYRISVNHNKVPVENLEKWNHINKDLVKAGMHLVVGFLKVKTALSSLAKNTSNGIVNNPLNNPVNSSANNRADTQSKNKPVVIPADKQGITPVENQAKNKQIVAAPDSQSVNKRHEIKTAENKPAGGTRMVGNMGSPGSAPTTGAAHFNGGYFKADYNDQSLSASGLAGTFKSTSGWQDGKYYALMNNVAVGTIIKITVPAANKTIYAKVLGQLPDMKESSGMTVRISNAAASELGQTEGKFDVDVRY